MIDFSMMIGTNVLLKKIPHPGIFEAHILKVSTNGQFVNLRLQNGEIVWEEVDQLQLAEHLE